MSLALFLLYGFYLVISVGSKYGWLWSPKGILGVGLGIATNYIVWTLGPILWWNTWQYTVTPTHLIAVHSLRRERVMIPWPSIVRVRKRPRPWWVRGGSVAISEIETADGQRIPFTPNSMLRYREFVEELKARAVNCQSFEAYLHAWDR